MSNEIAPILVNQADMVGRINREEVDIQIATAKMYPRNITNALNTIETYAAMDPETAADCFYVLRRKGNNGTDNVIEGLSIRMAEIIAGAWGNLRVQTMIIGNDGKTITARAMCHDLETNFAVALDVKRRITDRNGRTYSDDMQVVTGNAAAAIAFRNAVLRVVPKAVTKKIIANVKQVALGQALDIEQSRQNVMQYYAKLGVTPEMLFDYLHIRSAAEIGKEQILELRATANAIREGDTTVYETFVKPAEDAKKEAEAKAAANTAKGKVAAAMNASATASPTPAPTPKAVPAAKAADADDDLPPATPDPVPAPRRRASAPKNNYTAAPAEKVDPETGEILPLS